MPHLTPVSRNDFLKKLRNFGFEGPYSGGKHSFMVKGQIRLIIPNPHAKEISAALLSLLLKQAKIEIIEWNKL
jgi:predicted RNA binding protein YcfA (HicA-like mRNA interferase family)